MTRLLHGHYPNKIRWTASWESLNYFSSFLFPADSEGPDRDRIHSPRKRLITEVLGANRSLSFVSSSVETLKYAVKQGCSL